MTLAVQFHTLLSLIGLGMLFGVGFDCYRVLRHMIRPPRWMVAVCDVLIWWAAAMTAFVVLMWVNGGQIRFSFFIMVIMGGLMYYWLASRWVQKCWAALFGTIYRMAKGLIHLFWILFIRPLCLLYRLLFQVICWLWAAGLGVLLFLLSPFHQVGRIFSHIWKEIVSFVTNWYKKRL